MEILKISTPTTTTTTTTSSTSNSNNKTESNPFKAFLALSSPPRAAPITTTTTPAPAQITVPAPLVSPPSKLSMFMSSTPSGGGAGGLRSPPFNPPSHSTYTFHDTSSLEVYNDDGLITIGESDDGSTNLNKKCLISECEEDMVIRGYCSKHRYVYMCVFMYVCIYLCMYIYICIYI